MSRAVGVDDDGQGTDDRQVHAEAQSAAMRMLVKQTLPSAAARAVEVKQVREQFIVGDLVRPSETAYL